MEGISNTHVNLVQTGRYGAVAASEPSGATVSTLGSGTWGVTTEAGSGLAIAGEEPVSDEALRRDDALGKLISTAYGI